MSRARTTAIIAGIATVVAGALAFVVPATSASAAECGAAWSSSAVYHGGGQASHNGRNWSAKWWTQNETPGTADVWADQGACGGGTPNPPPGSTCNYPAWAAGTQYRAGDIVRYTDNNHYRAEHDNPGYDPVISTWYWEPFSCSGGSTPNPPSTCNYPAWAAGTQYRTGDIVRYTDNNLYRAEHDNPGYDPVVSTWFWEPYTCGGGSSPSPNPNPGAFVVSEAQFNQMFPNRNSFYTYAGLTAALSAYPAFAKTGSDTVKRQEAAAFLANAHHETGGLVHIVEQNTANYPHYCDPNQSYGCPAGQAAYYGRGPIQLSWNFNYKAAGDALGINLLADPYKVERESDVAWKTALWYWNTQSGPGTMTPHNAMVNGHGFGETIRSINGSIECNGGNPAQVQSRIDSYRRFVQILGVPEGSNLSC